MSADLSQRASTRAQNPPVSQEQRTEEAKQAFKASLKSTGSALDKELKTRADIIHANAKELDKQDKALQKDTKQLTKDGDAIEKFLEKSRKALPDMDSMESDIARIEAELDMFDEMLDEVEQRYSGDEDDVDDETAAPPVKSSSTASDKPQ